MKQTRKKPLTQEQLHALHEQFCMLHLDYVHALERRASYLTDEQLLQLAQYFKRQVGPNKSHNFQIPLYKELAELCRKEVWLRKQCREAAKRESHDAKKKSTQRNPTAIAKGARPIRARKDASRQAMHRS